FLSAEEFAELHAPAAETEAALVAHLEASGLVVTERFPNRLLVGAIGTPQAVERAFGVELHDVLLDDGPHVAALTEPVVPDALADQVVGVVGLDDLVQARPHLRARRAVAPQAMLRGDCCHLGPSDLQRFYALPAVPDGTGETLVVAGVYRWKDADVG